MTDVRTSTIAGAVQNVPTAAVPPPVRVTVVQPGARRHYAVPASLARAGLLKELITDLHSDHALIRAVDHVLPAQWKVRAVRSLIGRRLPPELPVNLVRDKSWTTLVAALGVLVGRRGIGAWVIDRLLADLERRPLGQGDIVYTFIINQDISVMRRLKSRGVKIVHDTIMSPDVGIILDEECVAFPGFESRPTRAALDASRALDRAKYALADRVLVPSSFVAQAVAALIDDPAKIRLVPFGFDSSTVVPPLTAPHEGYALFVGAVGLRKGSHYLAQVARYLAERGSGIEVHVVGHAAPEIVARPEMQGPIYHGRVTRAAIGSEYAKADVFVFPTLCEGMAMVHLEAMAHGLPVVTTPNCGSVVRDGIDGFIVPARDPDALAARVEQIVKDRTLRATMSRNARARAEEYTVEAYRRRLTSALREW